MRVLVIGATGLVGKSFIKLLNNCNYNIDKICFIASKKSRNKMIKFKGKYYIIKSINDIKFSDYTHAVSLTSSDVAKQIIPSLLYNNLTVIDNSSAYRKVHDLTIAELNFVKNKRLYVNPNCCIIQSIIPLYFINKSYKITKIIYNTYQSCSGGGNELLNDLQNKKINKCIPKIGLNDEFSNSEEEVKMINETHKLLNKNIIVTANCVRVLVECGHLVNIIIKVNNCSLTTIHKLLCNSTIYTNDISDIDIENDVFVYTTRLKQVDYNTYSFYTYANNLLRGASYNSFQTLSKIISNNK